jgi:glycosyltransferase involved in cell wall biosynthesis
MKKKISIITVNYNDKIGLEKTIKSVINQTYTDFEFVVIDGNSNDGSKEIIELYKNKISYAISEPDTGVYNAMNKGIRAANGEYVIFMNGGDTFYNDSVLEKNIIHFSSDINILYGKSAYFLNDIHVKNEIPPRKLSLYHFYSSGINHQAAFIKRELFFNYFFYNEDYKICSDWEFFVYALCYKNETYKYLDTFICNYDLSGMSAIPENKSIYIEEREKSLKKFFPMMYDDYKTIEELNSKRIKNVLYIKEFPIVWKLFKGVINLFLLFIPKQEKIK